MTTQQTKVDWSLPIEAVHEDGRVVPVRLANTAQPDGSVQIAAFAPGTILPDTCALLFQVDGNPLYSTYPHWRIRNIAQPQAPTPSPELTARMVALVKAVADGTSLAAWLEHTAEANAILAELQPVDGDRSEAERIAYDMEGALPRDLVEAGIKAGRALAEARELAAKLCDVMHLPGVALMYREGHSDDEAMALRTLVLDLGMPR